MKIMRKRELKRKYDIMKIKQQQELEKLIQETKLKEKA
jgi:hypothetical protein